MLTRKKKGRAESWTKKNLQTKSEPWSLHNFCVCLCCCCCCSSQKKKRKIILERKRPHSLTHTSCFHLLLSPFVHLNFLIFLLSSLSRLSLSLCFFDFIFHGPNKNLLINTNFRLWFDSTQLEKIKNCSERFSILPPPLFLFFLIHSKVPFELFLNAIFSKVIAKLFLIFGSLLFAPYYIWIVEH